MDAQQHKVKAEGMQRSREGEREGVSEAKARARLQSSEQAGKRNKY